MPEAAPEEHDEVEISDFIRSLGPSDVVMKLYKYDDRNRQQFLEDIPIESLQSGSVETMIRDGYGGGSYLVRAVKEGKWVKGGNKVLHIADVFDTDQGGGADYSGAAMQTNMQMKMMEMQAASSDRTMQLMMTLITAVLSNNRPMDPIALATLLKGNGGGGAENLTMLKEMLSIAKELQPGGGAEADPMLALAGQILPGFLSRMSGATPAAAPLPPAPAQLPPGPSKIEPPVTGQSPENPEMLDRIAFLKKLKSKAKADVDVEFWADYIEENQDEKPCQWILEVVQEYPWEALLAGLLQIDPELGTEPYVSWMNRLYDQLRAATEQGAGDARENNSAE